MKRKNTLLNILLSLVMALGMLSGTSMTVNADDFTVKEFTVLETWDNSEEALTDVDLPGFTAVTEAFAETWAGVSEQQSAVLIYGKSDDGKFKAILWESPAAHTKLDDFSTKGEVYSYGTENSLRFYYTSAVAGYSITLSGGENATASGGATIQSGVTGEMTAVTYTATANYKFPEKSDYYKTTNGITVERTSDTEITVSGTPDADVSVTVPDAVKAPKKILLNTVTPAESTNDTLEPVSYLDWDAEQKKLVNKTGDNACKNYQIVTDSTTNWGTGWYVVKENVTINDKVTVSGNVHLILCDNRSLNVLTSNDYDNFAITVSAESSLTVYSQSTGASMGALSAKGYCGIAGQLTSKSPLIINGGEITVEGSQTGIAFNQKTTIHGGNITASGAGGAIFTGAINFIPGTGWKNIEGTGNGETLWKDEPSEVILGEKYKRVQFAMPVAVTNVTLDPSKTTIDVNDVAVPLTAAIEPSNATDKRVKWNVSNSNVKLYSDAECETEIGTTETETLTVYAKGISAGSSTVTVTDYANTKSATCAVTVTAAHVDVTNVTLSPRQTTIDVNDATPTTFTAAVEPAIATDKTVKWSVSNKNVKLYFDVGCTTEVGSDATSALTVYAKGISGGLATVTVASNEDSTKTETCNIQITGPVSYMDWDNGQLAEKTCPATYTVVTGSTKTWSAGWYVVTSNVTISEPVSVSGNVHLILCDGATLTVTGGDSSAIGIGESSSLTVYGQSEGTGTLNAEGKKGISSNGNKTDATKNSSITIDSGNVTAKGNGQDGLADGIVAEGRYDKITINSGTVDAEGEDHGINAYGTNADIEINGGTVTAVGIEVDGIAACQNVIINGGKVTAEGGEDGIAATKQIAIRGNSIVKATGNNANGLYVTDKTGIIEIGDSSVTATGSGILSKGMNGKVKNSIHGTGWTDSKGTKGKADIPINTEGQTLNYKKVQFPKARVYYVSSGDNQTWQKGSSSKLTITFKCDSDDENTFERWDRDLLIDGKKISEGSYKGTEGSLVINLETAYLETLTVGKHMMNVSFSDGSAEAVFNIKDKDKEEDKGKNTDSDSTPAKKKDNVVTCQMAGYPANYAWNESAKACQPGYIDDNGVFHSTATARRAGVPNTYDKGVQGNINALLASLIAALVSAILLRSE